MEVFGGVKGIVLQKGGDVGRRGGSGEMVVEYSGVIRK